MKHAQKAGFTIVETMLFLGISGLLAMGAFIGIGSSINYQRYRDSVTSLQSFLQQQYTESSNVINSDTEIKRGQSNNVVMGKYITSDDDGTLLKVHNVIGTDPTEEEVDASGSDIKALIQYDPASQENSSDYVVEWGATLKNAGGDAKKFSMLIVRSPISGITRTFLDDNDTAVGVIDLISEDHLKETVLLCVDSNGMFGAGTKKLAIQINANATGASGIQNLWDNNSCG